MDNEEIRKGFEELRVSVARIEVKTDVGFSAINKRLDNAEGGVKVIVDCLTAHQLKTAEASVKADATAKSAGALWTAGIAAVTLIAGSLVTLYQWVAQHIGQGGKP